ncbi:unnamed protein product [Nesidiocoris tenuis]|uniref:Uncharacterized protein n=1 Tax=Nesidiocoris tenuis TaxID=355587 RepID=A0A6H5G7I0_9HEMI|nr:unnamed protein product [Nesidiocoris tenuis]
MSWSIERLLCLGCAENTALYLYQGLKHNAKTQCLIVAQLLRDERIMSVHLSLSIPDLYNAQASEIFFWRVFCVKLSVLSESINL